MRVPDGVLGTGPGVCAHWYDGRDWEGLVRTGGNHGGAMSRSCSSFFGLRSCVEIWCGPTSRPRGDALLRGHTARHLHCQICAWSRTCGLDADLVLHHLYFNTSSDCYTSGAARVRSQAEFRTRRDHDRCRRRSPPSVSTNQPSRCFSEVLIRDIEPRCRCVCFRLCFCFLIKCEFRANTSTGKRRGLGDHYHFGRTLATQINTLIGL
mmetsp:Transcript_6608/g.11021  ORF Transcript_6608/g.11021 Transcript_6608/m.11021 type:complete len:208 (-) Transcript_6608:548-1171(-)